jgi:hypothetical protein
MQKSIKQIKSEMKIMMRFIEQRNPDMAQVHVTKAAVGFLMDNGDQGQLEKAYVDLNRMVGMIEAGIPCNGCGVSDDEDGNGWDEDEDEDEEVEDEDEDKGN